MVGVCVLLRLPLFVVVFVCVLVSLLVARSSAAAAAAALAAMAALRTGCPHVNLRPSASSVALYVVV